MGKRKKKLIWIVGGMASGKSTLRNKFIELIKSKEGSLISDERFEFVDYGSLAVVGNCLRSNQCNGLDSSFGKLKKEGAIDSVRHCVENYWMTIVEGSQTSAQWVLPLCEICINNNADFYLVHLNIRLWENFMRLRKRIIDSGKSESDISDNKLRSVAGKNSQAELICSQCKKTGFVKVICINTEGMNSDDVVKNVLNMMI